MECRFEEEQQEKGVVGRLVIKGEVAVSEISILEDALKKSIESSDFLVVDCTDISSMDTSGLQLLCSAHRSAASQGKSLLTKNLNAGELDNTMSEAGFVRQQACSKVPQEEPCLWVADSGK